MKEKKLSEIGIGERIAYLRNLRGIQGPELAELSKVSRSTVYQIEKGVKSPTVATLEKLAKALDVDVAVLFATEDVHIFDMKRIPKYKSKSDLPPTLFKGFHEVIDAAKNLGIK
jgi:transcriptional regulator with XRE-family HTH domain